MAAAQKTLRCAIYTRKSTEHGLELEFNSLDAQREACAAYIKSQASHGWRVLPQHYDDPAYSGGNLDRPALRSLLKDIDADKVDVVVVYKIDRLTRSLADFAKLVEAFDAKSISFVAVTQQFNTTSSMGRLTLNVLLSFAQFERELSSERVRDKIAASRAKGKWTGGSIPLGYDVKDKKLVPNPAEQKTVRYIFIRYLELKSFARLVADLDAKKIVTKKRNAKTKTAQGGIPFTYGPLAYLLKNRVYVGETGHWGKWHPGEHEPILDRELFDKVQAQLASNAIERSKRRSESGALLVGKLYDDRDNLMSPSYSTKNGVRYRFYVSSALLRGRKAEVGSVGRVPAEEIERTVISALQAQSKQKIDASDPPAAIAHRIERVTISASKLLLLCKNRQNSTKLIKPIEIMWSSNRSRTVSPFSDGQSVSPGNDRLLQAIVRARAWVEGLVDGTYRSIEELAHRLDLHPKVVRQQMRFAFLDPRSIEQAAITDTPSHSNMRMEVPLRWPSSTR